MSATNTTTEEEIHPDILSWAREHGSERLRKGLEMGYEMYPLAYIEWVDENYPGFVLDLDDDGKWSVAECPSLAALQAEADLRSRPHVKEVYIVRARCWPWVYEADQVIYCDEEAECIVVRDERIPYDLVRVVEE